MILKFWRISLKYARAWHQISKWKWLRAKTYRIIQYDYLNILYRHGWSKSVSFWSHDQTLRSFLKTLKSDNAFVMSVMLNNKIKMRAINHRHAMITYQDITIYTDTRISTRFTNPKVRPNAEKMSRTLYGSKSIHLFIRFNQDHLSCSRWKCDQSTSKHSCFRFQSSYQFLLPKIHRA